MTFFEILFMALSAIFALTGFKLMHYASRREQESMSIMGVGISIVFVAVMLAALPNVLYKLSWPLVALSFAEIVAFNVFGVLRLFSSASKDSL